MVDAFVPRICDTGENTGATLGGIPAIATGSLVTSTVIPPVPPPFGEAPKLPITPPQPSTFNDAVDEGTFDDPFELGSCGDSFVEEEDADAPTDFAELAWDRDDPPVSLLTPPDLTDGIILTMLTRSIYKTNEDGGTDILYGFCRELTFDSNGALATVTEEARVIIDEPVDCTGSSSSVSP